MKTVIVTIPGMIFEEEINALKKVSEVQYVERNEVDEDSLAMLVKDADVLMLNFDVIVNGCGSLAPGFWKREELKNLKNVAFDMTGIDWASPAEAIEQGIILSNIPHYSSQSVAESILAEVLIHSRQRHLAYVDEIKSRKVEARKGINLKGRTLGVIGYGSIGSEVAQLARAIGMRVLAWNRSPIDDMEITPISEIFKNSDVVVVALKTVKDGPTSTVGIIDREVLFAGDSVILVNLANHALVDEYALADAIREGKISAYSLDRNQESLEGPLKGIEAVHFAPSNAWNSDESMDTLRATWASNAVAFISGEPVNQYQH